MADDVRPISFLPNEVTRTEFAFQQPQLEVHVLNVSLEMRRLIVFAATQGASVVFLARVVEHVHFQVGLVDEALIALRTLHFGFWLVVADRVELE